MKNEDDVRRFGLDLADYFSPGDVLALIGTLGVGKTTLTKYIARGMDYYGEVTSPTFTVINEYRGGRMPIYHFDFYRLGNYEEFFESGGEEYIDGDGLCVIEWADIMPEILPNRTKCVFMNYAKGDEKGTGVRIYECTF